jgi:hypothetical protein
VRQHPVGNACSLYLALLFAGPLTPGFSRDVVFGAPSLDKFVADLVANLAEFYLAAIGSPQAIQGDNRFLQVSQDLLGGNADFCFFFHKGFPSLVGVSYTIFSYFAINHILK